jgi:hypothetical protein
MSSHSCSIGPHTSAYVSIRQHTSAHTRQHTFFLTLAILVKECDRGRYIARPPLVRPQGQEELLGTPARRYAKKKEKRKKKIKNLAFIAEGRVRGRELLGTPARRYAKQKKAKQKIVV